MVMGMQFHVAEGEPLDIMFCNSPRADPPYLTASTKLVLNPLRKVQWKSIKKQDERTGSEALTNARAAISYWRL
jgi:hypothetical protein